MMLKMNAVFGVTFSLLVLVGIGSALAAYSYEARFTAEYGAWLRVCMPMPSELDYIRDRSLYRGYTGREPNPGPSIELSPDDRGDCPFGQHQTRSVFRVKMTLCRPLPPASNADAAEYLRVALQDLRQCPVGQFPMRYGAGKGLGRLTDIVSCVPRPPDMVARVWDWEYLDQPISDTFNAFRWAGHLAAGSPCPPTMQEDWFEGGGAPAKPDW